MIDYKFVPLANWPGKRTPSPKATSPFRVGYGAVLEGLEHELRQLGAKECLFEADLRSDQIRLDGRIRAGERSDKPGIVVSFQSKHGPLRVACDRFKTNEDNLRAIGLHLEHLRLASLYGVGESGEQYKGWARLEAGSPIAMEAGMSPHQAALLIAGLGDTPRDYILDSSEAYRTAVRKAMAKTHPDVAGNTNGWDVVQRAKAVLDAHFGLTKNAGGA